jgi:hypothetical protein
MGTLVVRAWAESGSSPSAVRARVLVISGPDAQVREIGVAAGVESILELVADGLEQGLSLAEGTDLS